MGVIKSINTPISIEPFSLRDIEAQGQAMLLRARKGAEMLLLEAQKESIALKQQAKAEGYAEGHREGTTKGLDDGRKFGHTAALAEMKDQLTKAWSALTTTVTQLDTARRDLEADGISEVIALSSAIARRVTKRQSMLDPAVLTENIQEAMKLAVHAVDVRIVINPAQRKTIADELPKLQMNWPNLKHVELIEDPTLTPGSSRILTRFGEVNAEIEKQLDRVINELLPAKETPTP